MADITFQTSHLSWQHNLNCGTEPCTDPALLRDPLLCQGTLRRHLTSGSCLLKAILRLSLLPCLWHSDGNLTDIACQLP